jgi:AcrR family transcriptional regulator
MHHLVAIGARLANATSRCIRIRFVPSETRRRPGGRTARVRSAVLQAALEELAEGGYAALTFESVARRAGVHKTTLYRRWGTRENLLLDAMLERGRELVPIPDTGSLREDLLEYGRAIAANVRAPEAEALVRAAASVGDSEAELAQATRRFWNARLDLAAEMVERAVARGEIPPQADPHAVVEAVVAPIYFRLLMSREELGEDFLERLAELVYQGAAA